MIVHSDQPAEVIPISQAQETRVVCVLLVLQAMVSYRSVPRILELSPPNASGWIPHFTSVIHWTLRVGLGLLNQVSQLSSAWIALMDISINIGTQKALVVLRVSAQALALRGSAIRLEDCECIGLRVLEQTKGETIADCLTDIFNQAGDPVAIVKDQGSDLAKGVKLWKKRHQKQKVEVVDDLGHEAANGLKAQFKKLKIFEQFLKKTHQGAARLRQTAWAFLMPPKIRTKGRFQSIGKLAEWGAKTLGLFQQKNDTNDEKQAALKALRKAIPGFSRFKQFIQQFAHATQIMHDVLKLLKHEGLTRDNYQICQLKVETLPERSKLRQRLLRWLERHHVVRAKLEKRCGISELLVSTDILESLFGKYKYFLERSPIADMNRTVLLIPALCGPQMDARQMKQLFAQTRHEDIARWEKANIAYTLRKKRRAFFDRKPAGKVPKTGK